MIAVYKPTWKKLHACKKCLRTILGKHVDISLKRTIETTKNSNLLQIRHFNCGFAIIFCGSALSWCRTSLYFHIQDWNDWYLLYLLCLDNGNLWTFHFILLKWGLPSALMQSHLVYFSAPRYSLTTIVDVAKTSLVHQGTPIGFFQ